MKIDKLKAELQKKKRLMENISQNEEDFKIEIIGKDNFEKWVKMMEYQAEISALEKGIESCEEILNTLFNKGRLDALKGEVENLQKLGLIKIKRCSCFEHELMNDTYDLVYKRLVSIQEEIKLIEGAI